jgi:sec-independent protein translocase protein TatB
MGDDFEELRKPLQDLQQLRNFDPRRAMTRHLLDDVDTGNGTKANGHTPPPPAQSAASSSPAKSEDPAPRAGDKAPFDPDAT